MILKTFYTLFFIDAIAVVLIAAYMNKPFVALFFGVIALVVAYVAKITKYR